MARNHELRWAVGLSLLAAAVTSLPYLIVPALTGPGSTFSGFLINPTDGYSYLAKMQQGADLLFEFRLPYAADPGPGVLLFTYQMFLGAISRVSGLPQILIYHVARIFGTLAMYAASYLFLARALPNSRAQWSAFVLVLFGTGLGWLALPLGLFAIDLWVPEAIPFFSAYANAHFPLATATLITSVTLITFPDLLSRQRLAALFLLGVLLAVLQPFVVAVIGLVMTIWFVGERLSGSTPARWLAGLVAFVVGATPVMIYTWGTIQVHPVLRVWNGQNLTPTPPLIEVLVGYGLVLILAIIGLVRGGALARPPGRLLTIWALLGFLLLFAPVQFQRRLALGLFIPLAALAGLGLNAVATNRRAFGLLLLATVLFSLPSHLVVIGSGLTSVSQSEANTVVSDSELAMMEWIQRNLSHEPLVLAGLVSGNRLPAHAEVRVLYGHPFETPHAESQIELVERLWQWTGDAVHGLQALQASGVGYAFYGAEERAMGTPAWLALAELAHREGEAELYKVPQS